MNPPLNSSSALSSIEQTIGEYFSGLSADKLNAGAGENTWSIAQCLQHIIKTNQSYFPALEQLAQGTFRASLWQKYSPFSASIGRNLPVELGAIVRKKYKAPRIFQPAQRDISPKIVEDVCENLHRLQRLADEIMTRGQWNTVISSPVSPLITFSAGSAITMLIGHTERHVQQAKSRLASSANLV